MFELNGKSIVVTGAGSGIGEATAQRLRRAGANVLVGDISDVGGVNRRPNGTPYRRAKGTPWRVVAEV